LNSGHPKGEFFVIKPNLRLVAPTRIVAKLFILLAVSTEVDKRFEVPLSLVPLPFAAHKRGSRPWQAAANGNAVT
jgi:hypothetical protein